MANILYITFDGITDPLGRSQILPYLKGLSHCGHSIHILSQEKVKHLKREGRAVEKILGSHNISWDHIPYKNKPPILQPLIQRRRIKQLAKQIIAKKQIDLTHCRSYMAGWVGLQIKKQLGIPFVFDMRGFWPDERKEGGLWPTKNPLYRLVYLRVKHLEKRLLFHAEHIVSLTHRGKKIIESWNHIKNFEEIISVIPCCADLDHFDPSKYSTTDKNQLRKTYNLKEEDLVIGYVGSLGTWYMLDEMLDAFAHWSQQEKNLKLFFLSNISQDDLLPMLSKRGIPKESVRTQSTSYDNVPEHMAMFDVGLFFILPVFSKSASSPVKQGEMLSMGLPVICNRGVGDTDRVIKEIDSSLIVNDLNTSSYQAVARVFSDTGFRDSLSRQCRPTAKKWFDVNQGIASYNNIYNDIIK